MAGAREAGEYFIGFEAWEEYIARLERLEDADARTSKDTLLGIAWIHACLAQHRACAASYLRDVGGEFPPSSAEHLKKAADLYEMMSKQVLTDHLQAFNGLWTAESRQEQVQRMRKALPMERQAIAAIEEAMTLAGERPSGAQTAPRVAAH
jgi:hypothetical protein